MTAYNAKHPYEPDWQIPRGVWANVKLYRVYISPGHRNFLIFLGCKPKDSMESILLFALV